MIVVLTESERAALTNALYVAGEEYKRICGAMHAEGPEFSRLAEQFGKQLREANNLRERIDTASQIIFLT